MIKLFFVTDIHGSNVCYRKFLNALPIYGVEWLNALTLEVALHDDGWHVEYRQRKPRHTGGGPHYVIDAATGEIVSKKYYQ